MMHIDTILEQGFSVKRLERLSSHSQGYVDKGCLKGINALIDRADVYYDPNK